MNEFHSKLRDEILQAQNRRGDLVKQKLAFAAAAIGLGGIKFGEIDTSPLLYCAPVLALAFDLYVIGEDFGVKRAGAFLSREKSPVDPEERLWEDFVWANRDGFAVIAGPILSILVIFSALFLLWSKDQLRSAHYVWFGLCYIVFVGLAIFGQVRNSRLRDRANQIQERKAESTSVPAVTKQPALASVSK